MHNSSKEPTSPFMKLTVLSVTFTRPAQEERRSAFRVLWVGVPHAMLNLKATSKSKAGVLIIGNILQEGWPVKNAILGSFKEMVMSLRGNVLSVIKNPKY
jgi:hypothetical protein